MLEISILRRRRRNRSERNLTTLGFRRAEFGHFRDLLGKVPCDEVLEGRESSKNQESWLISFQVQEWPIPVNRNLGKNELVGAGPAGMNKLLQVIHRIEGCIQRVRARACSLGRTQGHCLTIQDEVRKAEVQTESAQEYQRKQDRQQKED